MISPLVPNRSLTVPEAAGQPADPATIAARLEDHARAAAGAFAPNTERALRADSRVFSAWCAGQGRETLPAMPETVADFVDAMAELRAPATVRRYCASIAAMHRAAGLAPPTSAQPVRLALRRMARSKGGRQRQAEPLNRPALDRMLAAAGQGADPKAIDLRDAALVAVAYDTLLRRSELVSLYIEDLAPTPDEGGTILVRKSKTDQGGEGMIKFLAPDTLRSLRAYLAAIGAPQRGALFRPVSRWSRAGDTALEAQEVPRIFRRLATAAELKTGRPHSGHSTRVGAAQDMLAAGLELGEVMQAGSWKSVAMVARYGERLLARRGAARKLAVIQNRA
ncbi:tyrosine-type recombinase/integrase [Lichenibacterium ramalinae]|uniref:Integrase n=1 Tax=Lichenibacterium ramalinae TaxID=2316527 RepID=A0A4Q2RBN9_9HYPH|nr:tyrosine-type recombinase/integrase [Lichenibacterium ramalinae]RYB04336.1 integrase [Lichenibacterium ramalinae]